MSRAGFAVALLALVAPPAAAVEGGTGAYLLGSRGALAGIVPPPGSYAGADFVYYGAEVRGVSLAGVPIVAEADVDLFLAKLSFTRVFSATIAGGSPAVNVTLPLVLDAALDFTAVRPPPLAGLRVSDSTGGLGDLVLTPLIGWHDGRLHYSAGLSVYLPTGRYESGAVNVAARSVDVLNTGRNVFSLQPVLAATWLDRQTGREVSAAASLLVSTENGATDYQSAPALNVEFGAFQHTPFGVAVGAVGYWYQQLGEDSGRGADRLRAALGANSLKARVFGAGPTVTVSGVDLGGAQASFQAKFIHEFGARRRFEGNSFWLGATLRF